MSVIPFPVCEYTAIHYKDGRRLEKYQPSGAGGTRSAPATPRRLQHLTAHFIQNGRQGPEICQTLCYWTLRSTFAK